jgi:hypothetical protein
LVAANKIDALDDESRVQTLSERASELGLPFFRISGVTGEGVAALLEGVWQPVATARALNPPSPTLLDAVETPLPPPARASEEPGFSGSGDAPKLPERQDRQTTLQRPSRRVRTGSGRS